MFLHPHNDAEAKKVLAREGAITRVFFGVLRPVLRRFPHQAYRRGGGDQSTLAGLRVTMPHHPCTATALCFYSSIRVGTVVALAFHMSAAMGQSLPPPSRTMYKCTDNKVVSYSDKPCLGAERLVVVPTRGVSKLSGKERIGNDVREELWREQFADALRPLSGMTPAQFEIERRRHRLGSAAQRECRQLDPLLLQMEVLEAASDHRSKPAVQRDLFMLRNRYSELGC